MKRLVAAVAVLLMIILQLPAAVADYSAADSPYQSYAYSGRFYDMFANPAALPMVEVPPGIFALSVSATDNWDASQLGKSRMSFIQDQQWKVDATFISKYVALTATFGSEFDRSSPESTQYDIYSSLRIELDAAYAFPHFSIGARVTGGNQMVRRDKTIDHITDVFVNAWFSPFDRDAGSEFFDLGVGAILEFSPFSAGVYVGKLLTLKYGNLYLGWDTLAESTSVSVALEGGRYTKDGDLMLVRPRASVSLQFLPGADLTIAASYLEFRHEWFSFNTENGYVSFMIRGGADGFYGSVGVVFNASDFSRFSPSISFSYIS